MEPPTYSNAELQGLANALAILRKQRPYLFDIDDMIKQVQNGNVELTVRIFNGEVTDLVTHKHTRKRYN